MQWRCKKGHGWWKIPKIPSTYPSPSQQFNLYLHLTQFKEIVKNLCTILLATVLFSVMKQGTISISLAKCLQIAGATGAFAPPWIPHNKVWVLPGSIQHCSCQRADIMFKSMYVRQASINSHRQNAKGFGNFPLYLTALQELQ